MSAPPGPPLKQWWCLAVGAAAAAATWSPVPLAAGAAAVPLVRGALRRRSERLAAERTAAAVATLCGTVAADLRAGRPPNSALADALQADTWSEAAELAESARLVLSAARFGGAVPQAFREAAARCPGAHGLRAVAACWQVAVDGGAGLAAALDRVAGALRAEADQREDVRAQLAGPRSTAVLLALLPAFGVVLGTGLGADPLSVLLHTRTGLACLGAGALLEWAGLAWTARIARAAEGVRPGAEGETGSASRTGGDATPGWHFPDTAAESRSREAIPALDDGAAGIPGSGIAPGGSPTRDLGINGGPGPAPGPKRASGAVRAAVRGHQPDPVPARLARRPHRWAFPVARRGPGPVDGWRTPFPGGPS
jgi:tight adherence protein B